LVFVGSKGFVQYSTDAGVTWKEFGVGTRVTSIPVRNNLERIPVLNSRTPADIVPLRYEGTWAIETYPTNISTLATDLGWDDSVTTPTMFDIRAGILNGMIRTLSNAVVRRVSVSARQGEIVRMTIDGLFKQETVATDTTGVTFSESGTPATFADSDVLVDGVSAGKVQSFDVTINVNPNPIYALNSRYFADVYLRAFEAEGRMTVVLEDTSWLTDVENVATKNTVKLDLGTAGYIQLDTAKINELSHAIEPNEIVIADITFIAKAITFWMMGGDVNAITDAT